MRHLGLCFALILGLLFFQFHAMAEEAGSEKLEGPFDPEVTDLESAITTKIPEALLEKKPSSPSLTPNVWTLEDAPQAASAAKVLSPEKNLEETESMQISIQGPTSEVPVATEKTPEEDVESSVRIVRIAPKVEVEKTASTETKNQSSEDYKIILAKDVPEKDQRKSHRNSRRPASAPKVEEE